MGPLPKVRAWQSKWILVEPHACQQPHQGNCVEPVTQSEELTGPEDMDTLPGLESLLLLLELGGFGLKSRE